MGGVGSLNADRVWDQPLQYRGLSLHIDFFLDLLLTRCVAGRPSTPRSLQTAHANCELPKK
jgi:hypothetical protein